MGVPVSAKATRGILFKLMLLVLALAAVSYAQLDTAWTFRYAGSAGTNYEPLASFIDTTSAARNIYVAGWAEQSTGEIDALLLKIDSSGHYVWAKTYPNMTASGAAIDASGNVYIAGVKGGGTANHGICILKYSPNGDRSWAKTYSEQGLNFASVGTIAIDSQYVYACGRADSTVRIIKYSLTSSPGDTISYTPIGPGSIGGGQFHMFKGGEAYLVFTQTDHWLMAKLSSQSGVLWERTYRDTSDLDETVRWSQIDEKGNIYVTGFIASRTAPPRSSFGTMKMDSLGKRVWTNTYNGPENLCDQPRFLMLDHGNVYVAGWSMHKDWGGYTATALVKHDSLGNQQWAGRFGSQDDSDAEVGYEFFSDEGNPNPNFCSINADDTGNVYLAGGLASTRAIGCVMLLLKYNPQGNLVWVRNLSYPGQLLHGAIVAIDRTGALYNVGTCDQEGSNMGILVVKYLVR